MSLPTLPSEIIFLILDHTTRQESLNLCLTNKRLAQLVQPYLFQYLYLRNSTATVKYCTLIASRPDLALAARLLVFGFRKTTLPTPVSFWKLLSQSLSSMSNITSLHFTVALSDIIFRDLTLPRLKLFRSGYFHPEVIQFLGRHPTITKMCLDCNDSVIPEVPQEFLPSLRFFMGSPFVAEKVVPGRPIKELAFRWERVSPEDRMFDIIRSFSLSSIPIIRLSCMMSYIEDNRISILTAIARYLPDLQTLHLSGGARFVHSLDQSFFESLASLLPSFNELRRLYLPSFYPDDIWGPDDLDFRESRLSAKWKKLCPELLYIKFPNRNMYAYDTSSLAWTPTESIPSESNVSPFIYYPF